MSWEIVTIIALITFVGGLILGFYLCTRWVDPGDEINIKKPKAKKGGILRITSIFNKKMRNNE